MFDGDVGFINETIEPYYAQRWYEQNKVNRRDVKEMFFGDYEVFTLFMLKDEPDSHSLPRDVTSEFAEFI